MKPVYYISQSNSDKYKFQVITPEGKKINFGAKGYQDFTIHGNKTKKRSYIARHSVNEDWKNLDKAGTWSRYVLWNKESIASSLTNMARTFGIKIVAEFY